MSIWYTITTVASFMVTMLALGLVTGIASRDDTYDEGAAFGIALLAALALWLAFVLWLWIGLVRTSWRWGHEKLGTSIFKYLQVGFFAMTIVTMLPRRNLQENLEILPFMLLAFDIVIGWMIFNFLVLAWFARCKIPLHAYWEIGSIVAMIIIQVWIFT